MLWPVRRGSSLTLDRQNSGSLHLGKDVAHDTILPGVPSLGPLVFFGLAYSLVVVAAIYDLVSRRRVHKAYLRDGALMVASVLRLAISDTGLWHAFARALTN